MSEKETPQAAATAEELNQVRNLLAGSDWNRQSLAYLLSLKTPLARGEVLQHARKVKEERVGTKVFFRGLIEFSNVCVKNCSYCGIRKSNANVRRYSLTQDEIVEAAKQAHEMGFGSIVLQSGEREDKGFVREVVEVLQRINEATHGEIAVTLSLGEQEKDVYRLWQEAGARRYLLRIESSNRAIYESIHSPMHSFDRRLRCLKDLQECGYQVGTGVMIGLPGQTFEDLADDLLFFKAIDADMIGMGPYVEHAQTPLYERKQDLQSKDERLALALSMIACLRLLMPDINIAAATALDALTPTGRVKALGAGANVIMPNLTPTKYRENYQLYDGKPCLFDDGAKCQSCLELRIRSIGGVVGYGEAGDSQHFLQRTGGRAKPDEN